MINDVQVIPTLRSLTHHYIVQVTTQYKLTTEEKNTDPKIQKLTPFDSLNYHNSEIDWEEFDETLNNVNWVDCLSNKTPNEILETFYSIILEKSINIIPQRTNNKKSYQ